MLNDPRGYVAVSYPERPIPPKQWLDNNRIEASIVMNQVFSIHAALSAQDASLVSISLSLFK